MAQPRATSSEQIVGAAAELFQRNGFQNTTIDDICRHVGIAKPTVYQYVKSKQAILEAVFEEIIQKLTAAHVEALDSMSDPASQLELLVRRYTDAVAELSAKFHIFFTEERELPPKARRQLETFSHRIADDFAAVLERCAETGAVARDLDPKIGSFLVIGMIASIARWYDARAPLAPEALAAEVLKLIGASR